MFSDDEEQVVNFKIGTFNLDKIVIDENIVCIRCDYTCKCYNLEQISPSFFIYKKDTPGISNKELINCLIDNQFQPPCEHNLLKYFIKTTDVQVNAVFG
jgi:hypothetical protein